MPAVRFPLAALAVAAAAALSAAQDKSQEVTKQKETAADLLQQAKVSKPTLAETANLLVYTTLPPEKAKSLADAAQKAYDTARKGVQAGEKDKPWPGKLTVFAVPERREFTTLTRLLVSRKPEDDEVREVRVSGDEPFVAVGIAAGAKATDAALRDEATAAVAVAVLDRKAGVGDPPAGNLSAVALPIWLTSGFGRAVALRVDPKALDAHRAKAKALFAKAKPGSFQVEDVWGDPAKLGRDADLATTTLVDHMVFGPDADRFPRFLAAFKPTADRRNPGLKDALEDARWRTDRLDADWKAWVVKGK